MKTTIEISDPLLRQAKLLASKEHLTLRSLVEEGLAKALEERRCRSKRAVEPVIFGGNGLSTEFRNSSWEKMRDSAYVGGDS
ncbi:MAG: DUF2191 domain-containing protein [Verrucomicrobia bacterium]|nr:MAG: DUF2191 domain-containing protein [Verrucomicrobiota bacterium]